MTTLAQIKRRIGEYLELAEADPQLASVVKTFSVERERLLQAFPFLALMSGLAESESAERTATVLEAVLFDTWWVDGASPARISARHATSWPQYAA